MNNKVNIIVFFLAFMAGLFTTIFIDPWITVVLCLAFIVVLVSCVVYVTILERFYNIGDE